jgi:probable rRNA maturation factor
VGCLVNVFQRQREVRFSLAPNCLHQIVHVVLVEEKAPVDVVSIHFVSDFLMRRYHKRFFQDPSSTDCMSFPLDQYPPFPEPRDLGDIFICPKIALAFAKNSKPVFWRELTLYLVHGMLHLLGYEDSTIKKQMIMRSREKAILKVLTNQGLLAKGTLRQSAIFKDL